MKKKFKLTNEAYKQILNLVPTLPELQKVSKLGNPLSSKEVKFVGTKDFNEAKRTYIPKNFLSVQNR